MMRWMRVLFVFFVAAPAMAGQPIHKHARVYIEPMPEDLDTAIRSEIARQEIPLNILSSPWQAQLTMREVSGFKGTEGHRTDIRLIFEVVDPKGNRVWPVSPGARHYWVKEAVAGWQSETARQIARNLSRGVQRHTSTASSTDSWWPWAKEEAENRTAYTHPKTGAAAEVEGSPPASSPSPSPAADESPHTEVEIDWNKKDETSVDIRFHQRAQEIKPGMTEAEIRQLLGDPLKIAHIEEKTFYEYKDMVVAFSDGQVLDIQLRKNPPRL